MFIDIIFLMLAYLAFYQGFTKGLIQVIVSSASWFVAAIIAMKFTPFFCIILANILHLPNPPWLALVSVLLIFGAVWKGLHIMADMADSILSIAHVGFFNRAAGGLLYTGAVMLVLSGVLWFVDRARLLPETQKIASRTYPALEAYPAQVMVAVGYAKPYMETSLFYFKEKLDEVRGNVSSSLLPGMGEPAPRPADEDESQ